MSEPLPSGGGPQPDATSSCPWCSAALPKRDLDRCPSCGAALHESAEGPVPGVTQIDVDAVISARTPVQKSRGIIGWLSGEYEAEATPEKLEGLEPPDADVRREMLRLELEALEAEVQARRAEAVAEAVESGELNPEEVAIAGAESNGADELDANDAVAASAAEGETAEVAEPARRRKSRKPA